MLHMVALLYNNTMETEQAQFNRMVGRRIQFARKEANLTQEALSSTLGFAVRQILSQIEDGSRKVSTDELLKLMETLKKPLEFFTDPFLILDEAQISWRANVTPDGLNNFRDKILPVVGLYRHLDSQMSEKQRTLIPQLPLTESSSFEDAEEEAERLGAEWKLGPIPSKCLEQVAIEQLKLLVLMVDAPKGISGAAIHLPKLDTIVINRNEPAGRRAYDLGHELFHVLTWNSMPPRALDTDPSLKDPTKPLTGKQKRVELLADSFTSALLMPRATIQSLFTEEAKANVSSWIKEKSAFLGVSAVALYWRLVALGHIPKTSNFNLARLSYADHTAKPKPYSHQFIAILHRGLDNGFISVGKAATLLHSDLNGLTQLFTDYGMKTPFDL